MKLDGIGRGETAVVVHTASRTVLTGGVGVTGTYLGKGTKDIALTNGQIGTNEEVGRVGVTQIVEVFQRDVEVLAQVQVELAQVEIVARIVVAGTNGQIIGYEVTEIGTAAEGMAFEVDIFQYSCRCPTLRS